MTPPMRLWIVRVMREAYVLAVDQKDAVAAQRDIERWEDEPTVEASCYGGERLDGWTDDCLVYTNGGNDITLAQAKLIDAAMKEQTP